MHFSRVLMPYVRTLVREYRGGKSSVLDRDESERVRALEKATIASDGVLREDHKWLEAPVGAWRAQSVQQKSSAHAGVVPKKKKVLMLGSGMVAGPAVDEILSHGDVELLVGTAQSTPTHNSTSC